METEQKDESIERHRANIKEGIWIECNWDAFYWRHNFSDQCKALLLFMPSSDGDKKEIRISSALQNVTGFVPVKETMISVNQLQ